MVPHVSFLLWQARMKYPTVSVVVASVLCWPISIRSAERLPNVVFVLADDLGWADTTLYGHTKLYRTPSVERFTTADNEFAMRKLLLARRLVEAGVRCVSVSFSDFDTHSSNFGRMRHMLPILDRGLTALLRDLEERGMLDDVTIVAWGEFGRTPLVN